MKNVGSIFLFIGIASIGMIFVDYSFEYLMWIDNWGNTVGWIIRVAIIIVGGGLYFVGGKSEGGVGEEPMPETNKPAKAE